MLDRFEVDLLRRALSWFGWDSWFYGELPLTRELHVAMIRPKKIPSPSFFHAEEFLHNFVSYRLCYIGGRLGGGKTTLGVALARWLYDRGLVDGIFTNMPVAPRYVPVIRTPVRAAIVLDEANIWADNRGSGQRQTGFGKFARKLESWWISPSKDEIDKRLRDIVVEREGDIDIIHAWWYKWHDRKYKGWFLWRNYDTVFNQFKSDWIPADDGGILDELTKEVARRAGSTRILLSGGDDEFEVSLERGSGDRRVRAS